jgi:2'-5' RNA ligase
MKSFKQFLVESRKTNYEYSSLLFEVPEKLTDNIISWGFDHVPAESLFYDPKDPSFGREDDVHVTLIYGLHTNDSDEVSELFAKEKSFNCKLGEMDVFTTNNKFDVLIIKVDCRNLHRLNNKMISKLETTISHPIYVPHVTICYLKKGEGEKFKGNKSFNNEEFSLDHVIFSPKTGNKKSIKLGGK